jgi:ubiquinone/menaquinone biosynthesis C-methylase UbiE
VSDLSSFSDVDRSPNPGQCVQRLDLSAVDLAQAKARLTALLRLQPQQRWLDVGCGVGHDLAGHVNAVGLDASMTMLTEARRRLPTGLLIAGDCHAFPVADRMVDACRIERVLQHVTDPVQVLAEARRCLRPRGRIATFEPDWSTLNFGANDNYVSAAVVQSVVDRHRHGRIGSQLAQLLLEGGFEDIQVERETVAWTSLEGIRRSLRFDEDVARAGAATGTPDRVRSWLEELAQRQATNHLHVRLTRCYATGIAL